MKSRCRRVCPSSRRTAVLIRWWGASQAERWRRTCLPTQKPQETQLQSLGWDLLEAEMATHSSTLAWKVPWREEPGGLQSMGSQRVGWSWVCTYITKRQLDPEEYTQGEHHVKKADLGDGFVSQGTCWLPENHQKCGTTRGRHGTDMNSEGSNLADTVASDF